MMQLKAIFSVLLRHYRFETAQPADSYRNDHSKMVVQLETPARVRYQRRETASGPQRIHTRAETAARSAQEAALRIRVDLDLCQGHAVCISEAPEVFRMNDATRQVQLLSDAPSPEFRTGVEKAVRYCPTQALRIVGAEEDS